MIMHYNAIRVRPWMNNHLTVKKVIRQQHLKETTIVMLFLVNCFKREHEYFIL